MYVLLSPYYNDIEVESLCKDYKFRANNPAASRRCFKGLAESFPMHTKAYVIASVVTQ